MAYGAQMTGWEFIYCSGQDGPRSWRNVGEWDRIWRPIMANGAWPGIRLRIMPGLSHLSALHPGWKSVCYPPLYSARPGRGHP